MSSCLPSEPPAARTWQSWPCDSRCRKKGPTVHSIGSLVLHGELSDALVRESSPWIVLVVFAEQGRCDHPRNNQREISISDLEEAALIYINSPLSKIGQHCCQTARSSAISPKVNSTFSPSRAGIRRNFLARSKALASEVSCGHGGSKENVRKGENDYDQGQSVGGGPWRTRACACR